MFNDAYPTAIRPAVITGVGVIGPPVGYPLAADATWILQELIWKLVWNN